MPDVEFRSIEMHISFDTDTTRAQSFKQGHAVRIVVVRMDRHRNSVVDEGLVILMPY